MTSDCSSKLGASAHSIDRRCPWCGYNVEKDAKAIIISEFDAVRGTDITLYYHNACVRLAYAYAKNQNPDDGN